MRSLPLFLLFAACSSSSPSAAKPGDVVLKWEVAESDRQSIRGAKLSDKKTADLDYDGVVASDAKVKVKVRLETATVDFQEEGKPANYRAPVKLTIEATEANGFELSNGSCHGPDYTMAQPPAHDMVLICVVHAKKPRYDVSFMLYAYGDGHIDDGSPTTIHAP